MYRTAQLLSRVGPPMAIAAALCGTSVPLTTPVSLLLRSVRLSCCQPEGQRLELPKTYRGPGHPQRRVHGHEW